MMRTIIVIPLLLSLSINVKAQDIIFKKVLVMHSSCSKPYIDYVCNYYKHQKFITFNMVLLENNTIRIWMSADISNRNSVDEEILKETSMCISIMDKVLLLSYDLIRDYPIIQFFPSLPIKSHPPLYIKDGLKELIIYITPTIIVFYPLIIEKTCVYNIEPCLYNYIHRILNHGKSRGWRI